MSIQLMIADDHSVVIDGLRAVLEKKATDVVISGSATNGKQVLEMAEIKPADVYLLDIGMPVLNGLETTTKLLENNKNAKVIILSIHDDRATVEKAVMAGVKGYITKDTATDDIVKAIYEVYKGRYFFSPSVAGYLVRGITDNSPRGATQKNFPCLTTKEREIVQLIADGLFDREIASKKNISINTVRVHKNNVMRKLDIHKQAMLIRYALKEGISRL